MSLNQEIKRLNKEECYQEQLEEQIVQNPNS